MALEDLMLPCPACETPYELGEEACSSCLAWLTSGRSMDSGANGFSARRRRARIVDVGTRSLLIGGMIGIFLIQVTILRSFGLGQMRDLTAPLPVVVIGVGILIIYGFPGRTLHHYPSGGLVRRGTPRLWKGAAASAALIANAIAACELVTRPILEERAARLHGLLSVEIAGAITILNLVSYAAVALVLLWNLIAHFLGPQDMSKGRRKRLMRIQTQRADRSNLLS